ncbi:MAG: UPF0280 family protein [Hadesarchaea archaeon]|nr:UPF0280 family protein [Hadesarchaea archaeon]
MYEKRWILRETKLTIKSDSKRAIREAIKKGLESRHQIERFLIRCPEFRSSLEPLHLKKGSYPRVIELMLRAAEIAGTGPFAAVAGAISQVAAEAGIRAGASGILVDNGGDVAVMGEKNFRVGIYAGSSPLSGKYAFSVGEEDLPVGICTSSGSVGHSLNFGDADAVVIVADEASIADAVATAVANEVRGSDIEESIRRGISLARKITEIRGGLIIRGRYAGLIGKLPKIHPWDSREMPI